MSTSIQNILNSSEHFDTYLVSVGQNPKMYPTTVDKFIRICEVASAKTCLIF